MNFFFLLLALKVWFLGWWRIFYIVRENHIGIDVLNKPLETFASQVRPELFLLANISKVSAVEFCGAMIEA